MSAVLALIAAFVPEIPALASDIKTLFKKYPQLTPEQLAAAVVAIATSTDAQVDADLAKIAADQAGTPKA